MRREHLWYNGDETEEGSRIIGIDLSQYHSGQHISHLGSPRIEHDPP